MSTIWNTNYNYKNDINMKITMVYDHYFCHTDHCSQKKKNRKHNLRPSM